jgi:multidrug efflux pump subunit AcrA (membrane-fusion protein)
MARRVSFTRHGLPLLALGLFAFSLYAVLGRPEQSGRAAPLVAPPTKPYPRAVAASGIVEPNSEIVAVATELGGIVGEILVATGDDVAAGRPLFRIDARSYSAALAQAEAALALSRAAIETIDKGIALQESAIAQARAAVASATAEHERALRDRARYEALSRADFASRQRFDAVDTEARKAAAALAGAGAAAMSAERQLEVLRAQRREAEARVRQSEAALERARIDLDKTTVRAPIAGRVLKLNLRLGEFAPAGALASPLVVLGAVDPLHVRVDVDETEAHRLTREAPAVAQLRGNAAIKSALVLVRAEPQVIPKRNLSGAGVGERVDVRVLQLVYRIADPAFPGHVGQQVDVFIAAGPRGE